MQISTRQLYDRSTSLMQQLSVRADTLQTQLATSKKVNTASDDVAAFQSLSLIKRSTADDTTYGSNITLAKSLLAQSDSTLAAIESQLQHAAELATQANNGTLSPENRKVIGQQLTVIVQDLVALANAKDGRGEALFGAATGDNAVVQASDGSVAFTGAGEVSPIPVGDGIDVQATDSAARLFGGIATASGPSDMFAVISKLATALIKDDGATAAAADAGNSLKSVLAQVGGARGSVGARAARLDLESDRLSDVALAREIDRSGLEDTDIMATITELQKTMTVLQATQSSFSKLSALSLFDYLR
ncbi:flagellin [Sphingomonas endolithica]|uniref:flagellin N-terminal helical domain-containing protein n=1 Tax=Sphingomonas endolithica TaxID=2972485 RepID=UPI0021AFDB89|nr:flagellin [Sphingomonas sp. ZFBP2030]